MKTGGEKMNYFEGNDLKHILEAAEIGVWRMEKEEGKIERLYANRFLDELLGIKEQVTPEERFLFHRAHVHPDDMEMFKKYAMQLDEEKTEVVYRYIHPQLGEMYVRCAGVKEKEAQGVLTLCGTHQNISETIRYEKNKISEERLAEAAKEKEKALQEAKRENAAKTDFLSRMSHDIRTPLNGILGIMDINEKHSDDLELVAANRKKAKMAAKYLLSLLNDVLDMSKLEADTVELSRQPFDLQVLIMECLSMCGIRAKENGIILHHDCGSQLKYKNVYGSELHVKQVFMNLLTNSIKYNRAGGDIYASSSVISVDDNKVIYQFEIEDTGIGMSEEFVEHIFEPFTQESIDARSKFRGTGIGMAIVKKLVDKMDGSISVKSKKGVGTKFTVILPFEINHQPDEVAKSEENTEVSIKGMQILLAEDNELNAEIARCILEDAGAVVTHAPDGKAAYDIFCDRPMGTFDAILMDIMMPVLNGYEATKMIRESKRADAGEIPIIAITANAFTEDKEKAKEAGMNEHLAKPLEVDLLLSTLTRFRKCR